MVVEPDVMRVTVSIAAVPEYARHSALVVASPRPSVLANGSFLQKDNS